MSKTKKGVCIALAIIICLFALGGVSSLAKTRDEKKIEPLGLWSIGSIDKTTGKYIEDDQSIYTKEKFECYGLRVVPDFESTVTYDVFYYDSEDNLMSSKLGLTDTYEQDYIYAQYCRIVIHPEIPEGENKSFKVGYFDIMEYAKMLKITVSTKESPFGDFVNLAETTKIIKSKTFTLESGAVKSLDQTSNTSSQVMSIVDVSEYDSVRFVMNFSIPPQYAFYLVFVDDAGAIVESKSTELTGYTSGTFSKEYEIPTGATGVTAVMPIDSSVIIYGLN